MNKNNMKAKSKKLYRVMINSIEDGVEFKHFDSKNVVAVDVEQAIKKVRLRKTKTMTTFVSAVEIITEIDKL